MTFEQPNEPGRPAAQNQSAQEAPAAVKAKARELADGEWHRLHPATPLLRGGLVLIIVAGIVVNSFRDRIFSLVIPDEYEYGSEYLGNDPVIDIVTGPFALLVLGAVLLAVLLAILGFYLSWRVHRFRITGELVEVQQGILFRQNRRAPLSRIQGINVTKPWFARILGACKLDIEQAGNDSNVKLEYLATALAEPLRREILLRASASQQRAAGTASEAQAGAAVQGSDAPAQQPSGGYLAQRANSVVSDFLHPDAEVDGSPESLVRMHPGRAIASSILDGTLLWLLFLAIGVAIASLFVPIGIMLISVLPGAIILLTVWVRGTVSKLRFSIAGTQHGIRISRGLASITNETLPPGRIFAVRVKQPLLWRPFGWWTITFSRAGQQGSEGSDASNAYRNTLLPVGKLSDVHAVLALALPTLPQPLLHAGLVGRGNDGFTASPPSARWFRWFSWRRNGMVAHPDHFVMRTGRLWRSLTVVPQARAQSIRISQGPLYGAAGLARLAVHTVGSVVSPSIGALGARDAAHIFSQSAHSIPAAIARDDAMPWSQLVARAAQSMPTAQANRLASQMMGMQAPAQPQPQPQPQPPAQPHPSSRPVPPAQQYAPPTGEPVRPEHAPPPPTERER